MNKKILILLLLLIALLIPFSQSLSLKGVDMVNLNTGWVNEEGEDVDLQNPPKECVMTLDNNYYDTYLCFISKNINLSIYHNNELLYDFHPYNSKIYGKSYGHYIHFISIRELKTHDQLKIKSTPIYSDNKDYIKNIYITDASVYIKYILKRHIFAFCICFITVFIGVCMIILGVFFCIKKKSYSHLIALGLVSVTAGIWGMMESLIIQLYTGNTYLCHFLNYLTLLLIPISAIYLIGDLSKSKRKVFVSEILGMINVTAQILLTLYSKWDYHDLLPFNHGVIVIMIIESIITVVKNKQNIDNKRIILTAFFILGASGLVDIFRYYYAQSYGSIFMLGILAFIIILGCYELRNILKVDDEIIKSKIMKDLAYKDGLTKLKNRMAFNEREKELLQSSEGHYIIVFFDINNLKKTNDNYGHLAGDALITASADVIKKSFSHLGDIFRTGGDEFVAILTGKDIELKYEKAEFSFKKNVIEYNKTHNLPIKLEIAYGAADYLCGSDSLGIVEQLADKLMYEHKLILKEKNK